jgi:hypothetical protein
MQKMFIPMLGGYLIFPTNTNFRYLKKKTRIKELLILAIWKPSKSCWVSKKNGQKIGNFLRNYLTISKIETVIVH